MPGTGIAWARRRAGRLVQSALRAWRAATAPLALPPPWPATPRQRGPRPRTGSIKKRAAPSTGQSRPNCGARPHGLEVHAADEPAGKAGLFVRPALGERPVDVQVLAGGEWAVVIPPHGSCAPCRAPCRRIQAIPAGRGPILAASRPCRREAPRARTGGGSGTGSSLDRPPA